MQTFASYSVTACSFVAMYSEQHCNVIIHTVSTRYSTTQVLQQQSSQITMDTMKAKVPSTLLSMRFKVTIWADSFTLLFFSFLNVYNRTQFLFSNVQPKFGCQLSEWATEITEFVMKTEIICKQNTPWELFEIRQELRALCLRVDEHLTTENCGWLLDKPYWTIKKKKILKTILNIFCTNFNYDL